MSDGPRMRGWWQASDGKWYPPEDHPNYAPPTPPPRQSAFHQPPRRHPEPEDHDPASHYGRRTTGFGSLSNGWKVASVLGAIFVVVLIAAVVGNGHKKHATAPNSASSPTAPGATAAATSPSGSTLHHVGDKVTTSDGNGRTVQIYSAGPVTGPATSPGSPTTLPADAPAGTTLFAIDVEGCAGTRPDTFGVNPFDFDLVLNDNTRADTAGDVTPELHAAAEAAGTCNRGFVSFAVPSGKTPAEVDYSSGFLTQPIRWSIG